MKLIRLSGIFVLLLCLQAAFAQFEPDSFWIFKDSVPDTLIQYFTAYTCDTDAANIGCFNQVDTGASLDGSNYINFDYQFTAAQPGWAAFKIFWDMGVTKYNVPDYDSISFWHKGPLPGHKVHLKWAWGGVCGGPIHLEDLGEFKSSTTWKHECIAFPPGFVRSGIYELRMLISDDSSITTSQTSDKVCLKIDNICFIKHKGPPITSPAIPVLSLPANNATVQNAQLVLTWNRVDSATDYSFEVGKDSLFSSLAFFQYGQSGTSATITGLANNTTYYWHAAAADNGHSSLWAATWSFTTATPAAAKKKSGCGSGFAIALFPPIFFKIAMSRRRRKQKQQAAQ